MKIVIVDKMTRFSKKNILDLQKVGRVSFTSMNKDALKMLPLKFEKSEFVLVPDPDIFNWNIQKEELKRFSNLKAICLPTTSYECIDLEYCKEKNIIVTNVPNYSTESVAEYAIWMMLSLVRKLPELFSGKMNILGTGSLQEETKGRIMGVIGLGNIGTRIAEYGDRLGMKVIYYSKSDKDTFFERVSLKKLLKSSEFVFPCYEINKNTKKLLDTRLLGLLKETAYFISVLGDSGFDCNYLKKKVSSNKLAGLAYESEKEWKKKRKSNIFTPPPVAWYTKESQKRCYDNLTNTIISVCKGKPINQIC